MSEPFNIVVVGAGVTGLTLAAELAASEQALRITVIDTAARPRFSVKDDIGLRVSAIATGSADILDSVGAWRHVSESRLCAYERMHVWDERDLPGSGATLRFDAAEFGVPQLGFIVENLLLQDALLQALQNTGVSLRFDTPIRSLGRQGQRYRVELDDDRMLLADLVVGADGARSFVRTAAGIETNLWSYDQTAFVTHLQPEESHRNTAWQRFLKDGPIGMLPLSDGRVSVVWSTTPENAARAIDASDEQLGEMLTNASGNALGDLVAAGPRGSFSLAAQHASNYVLPGIALIGDAAHAIHPLAGQGANLGLQDATELANVIVAALAKGEHPADMPVLRRYERARKGANATMLHFMTGLNRLFSNDSPLLAELRMVGMRLFNRSGPLRERAVRTALGVG
ncbi:MAG: UbiH/UbiF/VisC/COQ6 family ubiquinone biosynthesis hydroxylase [Gammaproteobacteria bacterium]|nr:UbiH/UbiF/VisC/COQ6 family ubiquinone biosynthesis hydroxylase [Gammaproteobacteria bacterium]